MKMAVLSMIMIMLPTLMAQEKAIRGYDPVAYFTDGAAVSGQDSISLTLNGKKWCFSSTAHWEMFSKSPKAYAPQFGEYCAYAVGNNYLYEADPEAWTIVDDRLYLNYSAKIREMWTANRDSLIASGHRNWPGLEKSRR